MRHLIFFVCLASLLFSCNDGKGRSGTDEATRQALTDLRKRYAPDRRTDRMEVELRQSSSGPDTLWGYTTLPAAWASLDSLSKTTGALNQVRTLPENPAGEAFGLIRVSVANIRTEPGHSRELTSQALLGTPVAILDEQAGWYLIRTPDRYIAWLEQGAVQPVSPKELEAWFTEGLFTCVPAQSVVRQQVGKDRIVSELVAGNLLRATGRTEPEHREVRLPDGRTGWVATADLQAYAMLATPQELSEEALLTTAFAQAGKPYLWGGTSPKAMDCSGLTKTAYYLNGYVIPRDASQQVRAGVDVPLDDNFSQLQRGDLLFFGNYREDGSERTTHVGFYLGQGRMLHAGADNGYIAENSLIAGDADYAAHRRESLLRARRLRRGSPGVVRIDTAFAELYTRSSSR